MKNGFTLSLENGIAQKRGQRPMPFFSAGFTLIETIIYIALFSIIIVGSIEAAYNLVEGSDRLSSGIVALEEGGFVLRKINWIFDKTGDVDIKIVGNKIEMRESVSDPYLPLTTGNVVASNLILQHIYNPGEPDGLKVSFAIDDKLFEIIKYLK